MTSPLPCWYARGRGLNRPMIRQHSPGEGCDQRSWLFRPRPPSRDPRGVTFLETVVVVVLLAMLIAISFPLYQRNIVHRSIRNTAHLIQGDLRLAQQMAVARAGSGPAVEMCFLVTGSRLDGYQVYPIEFTDRVNRTGSQVGGTIKAASAGGEFRAGLTVLFETGLTRACLIDASRLAVAFSGEGATIFSDADPAKDISLSSGGSTRRVTVVGITGRATVVEP